MSALVALCCGLSGCTEQPADPATSDVPETPPISEVGGDAADCSAPHAARAPLRRLTRFEYNNTVRDLLGITSEPARALPGEELGNGFGNDADSLGVSPLLVDGYRTIAQEMATGITSDLSTVNAFAGCDVSTDPSCVAQFIGNFGRRAYRRPLSTDEQATLRTLYDTLGTDAQSGVRAVIEFVLQAPQFLYRLELGKSVNAELAKPTDYEMATRLSYLLWGSLPDATLFDAAARDALSTPEQIRAQAERMVADPRAHDVVRYFHGMLLGTLGLDTLVRNAEYYPTFRPGMGSLFRQETEAFINHVIWQSSGTFAELMTAPYTFLNGELAAFYGFGDLPADQQSFSKVDFADPVLTGQRAGLLTQASILSLTTPGSRTNPIVRGKWLLTKMLCGTVADPPPGLMVQEPEVTPGTTARERYAQHREQTVCNACHKDLDPLGFGFENYDGVGLWRDTDNGLTINNLGEIAQTDIAGTFNGAVEFASKVAASQDAHSCFANRWLTFAYGRQLTEQDACTVASVQDAFLASGGSVPRLLVALTQTDAFLFRPNVVAGQ